MAGSEIITETLHPRSHGDRQPPYCALLSPGIGSLIYMSRKFEHGKINTISTANIQFVQSEYANIVVKNSFDEETARLFKAFENHSSAFPDASLNSLRVAAELSAARDRAQVQRGRGANRSQRFNNGRWMTRGRGRSDSGRFNQDWQYHSRFPNNYNNNNPNEQ